MIDARVVLDSVRNKVPPNAKMLLVWVEDGGPLHCSQANLSLGDVERIAASLQANALSDKVRA